MTEPDEETKRLSRMHLEALAQAAMREGLSPEQVAYEKWVDTQPIGEKAAWEEMGEEEKGAWCKEVLGRELGAIGEDSEKEKEKKREALTGGIQDGVTTGEVELVEETCEDKWRVERVCDKMNEECDEKETFEVEEPGEEMVVDTAEEATQTPTPEPETPKPNQAAQLPATLQVSPYSRQRAWLPTTTEDSPVKNKPQCPPCARLKRTWTRCRGGPPCIECQHRNLSADQCQSYDLLIRARKPRQKRVHGGGKLGGRASAIKVAVQAQRQEEEQDEQEQGADHLDAVKREAEVEGEGDAMVA